MSAANGPAPAERRILLVGPSGAGKTSLIDSLCRVANNSDTKGAADIGDLCDQRNTLHFLRYELRGGEGGDRPKTFLYDTRGQLGGEAPAEEQTRQEYALRALLTGQFRVGSLIELQYRGWMRPWATEFVIRAADHAGMSEDNRMHCVCIVFEWDWYNFLDIDNGPLPRIKRLIDFIGDRNVPVVVVITKVDLASPGEVAMARNFLSLNLRQCRSQDRFPKENVFFLENYRRDVKGTREIVVPKQEMKAKFIELLSTCDRLCEEHTTQVSLPPASLGEDKLSSNRCSVM